MAAREWFLHWDNAPVHAVRLTANFLDKRSITTIPHLLYSRDLAPTDYLFDCFPDSALRGNTELWVSNQVAVALVRFPFVRNK